ncbi:hypothetical protein ACHBTE_14640 [Streptomyces sp. M41]|uniref:hypothetical protein n=1 Tax=Streptomyces sp. M41 TaxID=3059412 RepID=UPI00374D2EA9
MSRPASGRRVFRQTAGAVGAIALVSLGATPAVADDPAYGLVLSEFGPYEGVKPGSSLDVPGSFTNTGTEALDKVWLTYTVSHGLGQGELPSNCTAWKIWGFDEIPVSTQAVCAFDQTVKPGVVYAPDGGLPVKVLNSALYESLMVAVTDVDNPPSDEATSGPVKGTGPALKLVERPDATPAAPGSADEKSNARRVPVQAANTADFQVTGDRLKGRVGETVDLKVKFTNAGPAWVNSGTMGTPSTRVVIKMPAGTKVTKAAGYCNKVSSGTYGCGTSQVWVDEGESQTYTFKLKIEKAVAGAKGSAALEGKPRPFDKNKDNDKAGIALEVVGAGGSTGGSGSAGGGSTSGSSTGGSGATGGSDSTGGSSTGGGSSSGGTSTSGSTDSNAVSGDLANTGSDAALPLAGAAAAAVGVGAGAVLLMRRRRAARQ